MNKLKFLAIVTAAALTVACNSGKNESSAAASTPIAQPAPAGSPAAAPTQSAPEQLPTAPVPPVTQEDQARALRPPAGNHIALVVFEDLECPACARAEPLLESAHNTYKIPVVRHDFQIPSHRWSADAHVMARYFDTVSPQLGEDFRRYIFMNQSAIYKQNLREWVDKFASDHHQALPAFYDSSGELRAKVLEDTELGRKLNVIHTPTVYLVSEIKGTYSVEEVTDLGNLFQMIDQKLAQLKNEPAKGK